MKEKSNLFFPSILALSLQCLLLTELVREPAGKEKIQFSETSSIAHVGHKRKGVELGDNKFITSTNP